MIHQSLALRWTAPHRVTYLDKLQAKVGALKRPQTETGAENGRADAGCAGHGV